jgi:hypothetical protein
MGDVGLILLAVGALLVLAVLWSEFGGFGPPD